MTQLQHPAALMGKPPHPGEVVENHSLDAVRGLRWNGRKHLLPARSAFFPWKQQWVEEDGVIALAGLERRQVENPWLCVELEPQAIRQQHQGPTRNLLRSGAGYKAAQRLSETIPIRRQRHTRSLGEELAEGKALHKHCTQERVWRPVCRATALSGANSPCMKTSHTLSTPWTKPPNPSPAAGGLHMFGVHACELPQMSFQCQTVKPSSATQISTEFLYPSPTCNFLPVCLVC